MSASVCTLTSSKNMASKSKLEDLDLSQDEIKRLGDAIKNEEFRKLLCEYAEEISDPENRRRYEEEIAQMENERGMDVVFIRPEPGYVLKTSIDGNQKAFINISKSEKIDKPNSERKTHTDGKTGLMWHIPHSFAPPREDHDKLKNKCQVYDFVVHPDTYRMAESNDRFKKLVEDTAMDGIEKQFSVTLDRKNVKRPKMQFKGVPTATVTRSRSTSAAKPASDASGLLKDMPYPYDNKTTAEKMKEREALIKDNEKKKKNTKTDKKEDGATTPKYSIVHRSEFDMQEYRNSSDAKPSTRPSELVIKIELPLLKSAAEANLDIFEKHLVLESSKPAAYKLDLSLPYPVDESKGSAKFDKQKRTLSVTLPVMPGTSVERVPKVVNGAQYAEEEKCNGDHKPLIEVLPDNTNGEAAIQENGVSSLDSLTNAAEESSTVDLTRKPFSPQVAFTLPDYSFVQDSETVTFVLKVKNVAEDSVNKSSSAANEILLQCTSKGEGGFPLHFSIFLRFADTCQIAQEHCSVDITADNVVLLLLKQRQARGLWDRFWVGKDSTSVEERLFLTTTNLQLQLMELDAAVTSDPTPAADQPQVNGADPSCDLQVTAMDDKKLTIKISPVRSRFDTRTKEEVEEDEEYDPPSSAEIQVIHSQPSPSLHGILKQRTISESSEDVNPDPESPRSPMDDDEELSSSFNSGKRRSVSFSKHIDRATFKSAASVSSMKTSLKSKRKRHRKWEEKQDKASARRRHNSTGSEGSGDDHPSLSDSHSYSEEEVVEGEKRGDANVTGEKLDTVLDERTKPSKSVSSNSDSSSANEDLDSVSEKFDKHVKLDSQKDAGLVNKVKEEEEEEKREEVNGTTAGSKSIEVNSKADTGPGCNDSVDNPGSSSQVRPETTPHKGSSEKGGNLADKIKSKLAEGVSSVRPDDSDDEADDKGEVNGEKPSNVEQVPNEHRTECAFAFSNEVMFDLDVE